MKEIYPNDKSTDQLFGQNFNRAKQPGVNNRNYNRNGTKKMYAPDPEASEDINPATQLNIEKGNTGVVTDQFVTVTDAGEVKIRYAGSIPSPGYAIYPGEADQFDFKQLVPIGQRKILSPRLFRLYYSVGFYGGGFNTATAPSSFNTDLYITFAFFEPNKATDTGSYANALTPFLNVKLNSQLEMINNGGLGSGFRLQEPLQIIDLLDNIDSRNIISSFGYNYRDFSSNRDKIDKSDLNELLNGTQKQIAVSICADLSTLTVPQSNFLADVGNLFFTLSYKFEYYSQLVNI